MGGLSAAPYGKEFETPLPLNAISGPERQNQHVHIGSLGVFTSPEHSSPPPAPPPHSGNLLVRGRMNWTAGTGGCPARAFLASYSPIFVAHPFEEV